MTALTLPKKFNLGSGRLFLEDHFNVDVLPHRGPDLLCDMSVPFPFGKPLQTKRFGEIKIQPGDFDYIIADNVMEHVPDLITTMTNCIDLLRIGGELVIQVPYDLSHGAWQDPTHVRAFNENSWGYFTHSAWYVGWTDFRFELSHQTWLLSALGFQMMDKKIPLDEIARTPRAVDQLLVKLTKRASTPEEKTSDLQFTR